MITFVDITPPTGGEHRLREALALGRRGTTTGRYPWLIAMAAVLMLGIGLQLRPPAHARAIDAAVANATRPVQGLQLAVGSASRMPGDIPGVTVYLLQVPEASRTD